MHQLHEELAVERAREEAKNAGFEEGLRQGRELYTASMYANVDMGVRLHRGESDSTRESRRFTRGENREKDRRSEVSRYVYPDEDASTVTGSSLASGKGKGKSTRYATLLLWLYFLGVTILTLSTQSGVSINTRAVGISRASI